GGLTCVCVARYQVGLSVVDAQPKELFYLSVSNTEMTMQASPSSRAIDFNIHRVRVCVCVCVLVVARVPCALRFVSDTLRAFGAIYLFIYLFIYFFIYLFIVLIWFLFADPIR